MSLQAVTTTRLGALPTFPAPTDTTSTTAPGLAPDRLALSHSVAPAAGLRAQGGILDWFVGLFDVVFGHGRYDYDYGDPYGDYRRYPMPGQIPPETSYGGQMMRILDDYDRQLEHLNRQFYRMPNQMWARRERNLWEQTCERIVRSYAPRDEKLAALGHVHNSSSMPGAAYQEYARRVGGGWW